jgi:hypothetical protein
MNNEIKQKAQKWKDCTGMYPRVTRNDQRLCLHHISIPIKPNWKQTLGKLGPVGTILLTVEE